jgi:hypothetical protein
MSSVEEQEPYLQKSEGKISDVSDEYSNLSDFVNQGNSTVRTRKKFAKKLMSKQSLPLMTAIKKKPRKSFLVDSNKNISSIESLRMSLTRNNQIFFQKKGTKSPNHKESPSSQKAKYNPYFKRDKRESSTMRLESLAKRTRATILIQRFIRRIMNNVQKPRKQKE